MANTNETNNSLVLENAILMSADIFTKLHKMRGEATVFVTADIIADEAKNLERELAGRDPDTFDYFEELEKHEEWVLRKWAPDDIGGNNND